MLRYLEASTEENARSEGLKALHRMATEVKRDGEAELLERWLAENEGQHQCAENKNKKFKISYKVTGKYSDIHYK